MFKLIRLLGLLAATVGVGRTPLFADHPEPHGTAVSISVRDRGAVGDGVADDSAAVAEALAEAAKAAAARVHLPAGYYRLRHRIAIDLSANRGGGLAVTDDGQGVTVIVVELWPLAITTEPLRVSL